MKIVRIIARVILFIAIFFGLYSLLGARLTFVIFLITLLVIAFRKKKA